MTKLRYLTFLKVRTLPLLDGYLLKHFLPSLLVASTFFTFIVLVFFLKETIKHAVEKNLEFGVILELCWYALGWTLTLTVPMAFLLSTILTVGALNADSEIIALRAGGITYPRIMRPFVGVAVVFFFILFWFSNFVVPRFADNMENMRQYILTTDPIAAIQPGQFITLDKREGNVRKIYIERAVKDASFRGEILQNIQVRKIGNVGGVQRLREAIGLFGVTAFDSIQHQPDEVSLQTIVLVKGFICSFNLGEIRIGFGSHRSPFAAD